MRSSHVMTYLNELCHDIDEGRPLHRFEWRSALKTLAIPLAMGLMVAPGCAEENCSDGIDNDRDHMVDCSDPDCIDFCGLNLEYAAPFSDDVEPAPNEAYAAPFPNNLKPPSNSDPTSDPTTPSPEPLDPPKPPVGIAPDDSPPVPAYGIPPQTQNPTPQEGASPEAATRYGAIFLNQPSRSE